MSPSVTIRGDTLEELFVEAAQLVGRQCGRTRDDPGPWRTLRVSSTSTPALLVEWLNELIDRSATEGLAFTEVRALRLYEGRVTADIRGRPVTEWTLPVKAASMQDVTVEREGARWKAEVRFDV